jgi:hypothetical protein
MKGKLALLRSGIFKSAITIRPNAYPLRQFHSSVPKHPLDFRKDLLNEWPKFSGYALFKNALFYEADQSYQIHLLKKLFPKYPHFETCNKIKLHTLLHLHAYGLTPQLLDKLVIHSHESHYLLDILLSGGFSSPNQCINMLNDVAKNSNLEEADALYRYYATETTCCKRLLESKYPREEESNMAASPSIIP